MLQNVYPTNPIISNNLLLAEQYNKHPESLNLKSKCLSTDEAISLVSQGAKFSSVICIDEDADRLLKKIGYEKSWDVEFDTRVEHYSLDSTTEYNIDEIHSKVRGELFLFYGMG